MGMSVKPTCLPHGRVAPPSLAICSQPATAMDPVTHVALGIATALGVDPKTQSLQATSLVGAAAALLPDADVLLSSRHDPLFTLEFHRHFTHSLAFSPVIALTATALIWVCQRPFHAAPTFLPLLLPAWLATLSHLLCDAWTSYGTHLWWPLIDTRVSLDWISVVDPLLTVPLLLGLGAALLLRTRRPAVLSLGYVAAYLLLCALQHQRALHAHSLWIARQNLPPASRITVKPSFANILVWRALSIHGSNVHTAAIRCGFGPPRLLAGASQAIFASADEAVSHFGSPPDSAQAQGIRRFHRLSNGWTGPHRDPTLLGDLRYATLPHTLAPLWCIRLNSSQPDQPVAWAPQRSLQQAPWPELWQLIQGRHPNLQPPE